MRRLVRDWTEQDARWARWLLKLPGDGRDAALRRTHAPHVGNSIRIDEFNDIAATHFLLHVRGRAATEVMERHASHLRAPPTEHVEGGQSDSTGNARPARISTACGKAYTRQRHGNQPTPRERQMEAEGFFNCASPRAPHVRPIEQAAAGAIAAPCRLESAAPLRPPLQARWAPPESPGDARPSHWPPQRSHHCKWCLDGPTPHAQLCRRGVPQLQRPVDAICDRDS